MAVLGQHRHKQLLAENWTSTRNTKMKEFSSVDAVLAQFVFSVTSIEINVQNEVSCKNVVLKPKTNI